MGFAPSFRDWLPGLACNELFLKAISNSFKWTRESAEVRLCCCFAKQRKHPRRSVRERRSFGSRWRLSRWTAPSFRCTRTERERKRNGPQSIGRSRGGSTKIHMVAADERRAVTFSLTPGQWGDAPAGRDLLRRLPQPADRLPLLMDRGTTGRMNGLRATATGDREQNARSQTRPAQGSARRLRRATGGSPTQGALPHGSPQAMRREEAGPGRYGQPQGRRPPFPFRGRSGLATCSSGSVRATRPRHSARMCGPTRFRSSEVARRSGSEP
jgi:hypothetical protein